MVVINAFVVSIPVFFFGVGGGSGEGRFSGSFDSCFYILVFVFI